MQEELNGHYVGDIGSLVGQDVYDIGKFKAVLTLAQDPSGTAPQLTDSASTGLNGTTVGAMTSSNLVDAPTGLGLDFDGVDDAFTLPWWTLTTNSGFSWGCKADGQIWAQLFTGDSTAGRITIDPTNVNAQFPTVSVAVAHGVDIAEHHNYALWRVGTTLHLFVDGLLAGSVTDPAIVDISMYRVLGKNYTTSWAFFKGVVSHFNLFQVGSYLFWS